MRQHATPLYRFITRIIGDVKKEDSIYIVDSLGGSFKQYISDNAMQQKLNDLVSGMDDYSKKTVDVIYARFLNYPEYAYHQKINPEKNKIIGGKLKEEELNFSAKEALRQNKAILEERYVESSVFQYYHGLSELPPEVGKYIEGGDFIDIGAYVGESALALRKYNYKKIFSIEMSQYSIERYLKTMKTNKIDSDKFEIINYAIAAKNGENVQFADSGSAGLSVKRGSATKDKVIEVPQKTLDYIVDKHDISPVFIKLDIEGAGMDCIVGAINSIKKHRPVMSIAIYHNPTEFFEIKPFLEAQVESYSFMIRKLCNQTKDNMCHAETILLAYPNEILKN